MTISLKTLLATAVFINMGMGVAGQSFAADVPASMQLSDKQELVRGNSAELQSLDPHKIEGVPESNVNRDVLEGLIINELQGRAQPGVRRAGETKISKFGNSIFGQTPNGPTTIPSPAQDFVYRWRRLADSKTTSPYESYLQYAQITNIDNIDNIISGKNPRYPRRENVGRSYSISRASRAGAVSH